MEEKAQKFVLLTVTNTILGIGLSIYLVLIANMGLFGLILSGTITQCVMGGVYWAFVGRRIKFGCDLTNVKP